MDESGSSGADHLEGLSEPGWSQGAVRLLATKGVEGTSFAEVLEATDSPRGSVYHHFPGGKPELLRTRRWIWPANGDSRRWRPPGDSHQRSSSSAFLPSGEPCWNTPNSPLDVPSSPSRSPETTTVSSLMPAPSFEPGRNSSLTSV